MNTQIKQQDSELVRAYERVKGELAALKPEQVRQVNLDVPEAVATIVCVVPGLKVLRERLKRELAAFDLEAFDKLEDYAWALSHAHTIFLTRVDCRDDLPALAKEAIRLRQWLIADVHALVSNELMDARVLSKLSGQRAYEKIAEDLLFLCSSLQKAWSKLAGRPAAITAQLDSAQRLSVRMTVALARRDEAELELKQATDLRRRAFSLAVPAYEKTRRAIGYIFHDAPGKADELMPPLYSGKARRKQPAASSPSQPALLSPRRSIVRRQSVGTERRNPGRRGRESVGGGS